MTLSGVVVLSSKPPTRSVVVYLRYVAQDPQEKGSGGGVPGSGMAFLRRDQILSDFYDIAVHKYGAKKEDFSKYVTNILLHELGAAIGLGHSDDRRNIMYKDPTEESLWYIKYFDLEQMKIIRNNK